MGGWSGRKGSWVDAGKEHVWDCNVLSNSEWTPSPRRELVPRSQSLQRVRLVISRHALSCANAQMFFNRQFGGHSEMLDPMLTDCGVHRSQIAAEEIKKKAVEVDL